jgi:hypothetical protein
MAKPVLTCVSALVLYQIDHNESCGYFSVGLLLGAGVQWLVPRHAL